MHSELLAQLVTDIRSAEDDRIIDAARQLLALGEYGDPRGTYLLEGGKAALRAGRKSDAVILLYHAMKVSIPGTLTWGETMVNRAVACVGHAYYPDAIAAGKAFLDALPHLPPEAEKWAAVAHHSLGQALDRMSDHHGAAGHHRTAAEQYTDPTWKLLSICNWAYSVALGGQPDSAEVILNQIHPDAAPLVAQFGYHANRCIVLYHQRRFAQALQAGHQALQIAIGHEEKWAGPVAELRFWMSRTAWELDDRYNALAWGLDAAVRADALWNVHLCEMASKWLEFIMDKGGLR